MNIRKATLSDIPVIRKISEITWPPTYGSFISAGQITYMIDLMYSEAGLAEQLSHPDHTFFLAEEDGVAYGFAGIQRDYPVQQTTKLHKIYVLPSAQGKHTGRKLIDHLTDYAKSENQLFVCLNVNRNNKAQHFYERLGFTILKEEDIDIGNGYLMEDFIMQLALKR